MLDVVKQAIVQISGNDVQTLFEICEMASRYIRQNKGPSGDVIEFDAARVQEINSFINHVFEKIGN